jgi:hypothetical protein
MKLTELQKKQIIEAVECLEIHPVYDSCERSVFELELDGGNWQLQVKITQDPDDFMERNDES